MLAILLAAASSCVDVRKLDIRKCYPVAITPHGLSSFGITLRTVVDNTGKGVELSDMTITVHTRDKQKLMFITAEPVSIGGFGESRFNLDCRANFYEGFSILKLKDILDEGDYDDYRADITVRVAQEGKKGQLIRIPDIPLERFEK